MMIVVLILTTICAVLAIRASRVLVAILWLALVSVLTSILFYLVGAWLIAVIELSVGTGLATVLMVFVITMIGDEQEVVPLKPVRLLFVIITLVLLCLLTFPFLADTTPLPQEPIQTVLWQVRGLDIVPQIALIFVGMIGVLVLLSDSASADRIALDDSEKVAATELISLDEQKTRKQEAA